MGCTDCKNRTNETNEESFAMEMIRKEKREKMIIIIIFMSIVVGLFGCIIYDNYVDSQYDTYEYEFSTEGGGNANFVGGDSENINN